MPGCMDRLPETSNTEGIPHFKETELLDILAKTLQEYRRSIDILILGSFRSEKSRDRLVKLRSLLISRGFEGAHLTVDIPQSRDPGIAQHQFN